MNDLDLAGNRLPSTIPQYLAQLRAALDGADPAMVQDALYDLAMALRAVGGKPRGRKRLDYRSAERARAFIMEHLHQGITLEMLEKASGREQWSLSRDFRALYGTSPYRFVTLRRLDSFRRLILDGFTLVDAALAAGFHDQSHMTRHFTRSYGVSPLRWLERLRPAC